MDNLTINSLGNNKYFLVGGVNSYTNFSKEKFSITSTKVLMFDDDYKDEWG